MADRLEKPAVVEPVDPFGRAVEAPPAPGSIRAARERNRVGRGPDGEYPVVRRTFDAVRRCRRIGRPGIASTIALETPAIDNLPICTFLRFSTGHEAVRIIGWISCLSDDGGQYEIGTSPAGRSFSSGL